MMIKHAQSPQPSVDLHIDELVLDGEVAGSADHLGAALERELTRLFADQPPTLTQGAEIALLDGGVLEATPASNSERTGAHLARTIREGLCR